MLNPATMVIRIRMTSTLKSISDSQSKSRGFSSAADILTTEASSSEEWRSAADPVSAASASMPASSLNLSSSLISNAET